MSEKKKVSDTANLMTSQDILHQLSQQYQQLSPQLKKAAAYLLENSVNFALQPIRKTADLAGVAPSTLMRLAKLLGFERYDEMRQLFQQALQDPPNNFSSRADSLQGLAGRSKQQGVVTEVAGCAYHAADQLFTAEMLAKIAQAAKLIASSPKVYVLGLRDSFACAYHLAYVGSVAMPNIQLIRGQEGGLYTELAAINEGDLLIAFGFDPYSRETVEAVEVAKGQGARLISITDNLCSPLVPGAEVVLEVETKTPNFFPSIVAAITLVEALLAVCVAEGGEKTLTKISDFDQQMVKLGGYYQT